MAARRVSKEESAARREKARKKSSSSSSSNNSFDGKNAQQIAKEINERTTQQAVRAVQGGLFKPKSSGGTRRVIQNGGIFEVRSDGSFERVGLTAGEQARRNRIKSGGALGKDLIPRLNSNQTQAQRGNLIINRVNEAQKAQQRLGPRASLVQPTLSAQKQDLRKVANALGLNFKPRLSISENLAKFQSSQRIDNKSNLTTAEVNRLAKIADKINKRGEKSSETIFALQNFLKQSLNKSKSKSDKVLNKLPPNIAKVLKFGTSLSEKLNNELSDFLITGPISIGAGVAQAVDKTLFNTQLVGLSALRGDFRRYLARLVNENRKVNPYVQEALKSSFKDPRTYAYALLGAKVNLNKSNIPVGGFKPPKKITLPKSGTRKAKTYKNQVIISKGNNKPYFVDSEGVISPLTTFAKTKTSAIAKNSGRSRKNRPISKVQRRQGVTRGNEKQLKAQKELNKLPKLEKSIQITKERNTQQPTPTDRLNVKQLKALYTLEFNKPAGSIKKAELKRVLNRKYKTPTGDFKPFSKVELNAINIGFKKGGKPVVDISRKGDVSLKFQKALKRESTPTKSVKTSGFLKDPKGNQYVLMEVKTKTQTKYLKTFADGKQQTILNPTKTQLRNIQQGMGRRIPKPKGSQPQGRLQEASSRGITTQVFSKGTTTKQKNINQAIKLGDKRLARFEAQKQRIRKQYQARIRKFQEGKLAKAEFNINAEVTNFMRQVGRDQVKIIGKSKIKSQSITTKVTKSDTKLARITKEGKQKAAADARKQLQEQGFIQTQTKTVTTRIVIKEKTLTRQKISNLEAYAKAVKAKTSYLSLSGKLMSGAKALQLNKTQSIAIQTQKQITKQTITVAKQKITKKATTNKKTTTKTSIKKNSFTRQPKKITQPKSTLRRPARGRRTVKKPIEPLKPKLPKLPKFKVPKSVANPKGFDAYVKSKTKWIKVNPKPLTKANASKLARYVSNNSLSASHVVVGVKTKAIKRAVSLDANKSFFRASKSKTIPKGTRIEKRSKRLNTVGEKRKLSASRAVALVRQRLKAKKKRVVRKKRK